MLATLIAFAVITPPRDSIDLRFAFFGCNRIEKADWEATETQNPSSANIPQLVQNFRDIQAMRPIPLLTFVGGDMVLGYADDDGTTFTLQMNGWRDLVHAQPLDKLSNIIPFPGNHEMNKKIGDRRLSNPPTTKLWNDWMRSSGFKQLASNGPKPVGANPDNLSNDQSILNYSFTRNGVHFVILSTDTATTMADPNDATLTRIAWIPVEWAKKDIARADQDPRVHATFVLGHRNLVDPKSSKGDAPIDAEAGARLLEIIRSSKKTRAYVCAHVHAWDVVNMGGASKAWQVIAGNGGSKLEKDWNPAGGTFFGFAAFDVMRSGRVILHSYRRPTPAGKYDAAEPPPPAAKSADTVLYDPVK